MRRFKRNQIDDALEVTFAGQEPEDVNVRTRTRRLLDTDRGLEVRKGDKFAFSTKPGRGSGTEVWFSEYEAFALAAGLIFLRLHWPQQTVVRILRHARAGLEKEFERIKGLAPNELVTGSTIAAQRREPGSHVFASSDPRFLVVFSTGRRGRDHYGLAPDSVHLCESEEALDVLRKEKFKVDLSSMSVVEVTALIRSLAAELDRTRPSTRGRKRTP